MTIKHKTVSRAVKGISDDLDDRGKEVGTEKAFMSWVKDAGFAGPGVWEQMIDRLWLAGMAGGEDVDEAIARGFIARNVSIQEVMKEMRDVIQMAVQLGFVLAKQTSSGTPDDPEDEDEGVVEDESDFLTKALKGQIADEATAIRAAEIVTEKLNERFEALMLKNIPK